MTFSKIARRWKVALALLLCIGVFFRFYHIDKKVFWMDEAASALRVSGHSKDHLRAAISRKPLWTHAEVKELQRIPRGFAVSGALRAMSKDAPEHTPFFYLLLRWWAGEFGDSVETLRALPALISLLVFPALWFLCRELFFDDPNRERISIVALALMAVSPFHVLYAQEVRQYSLMTVLILTATALLLCALRTRRWRTWALYALALAGGFYTHLLFALVWLAHVAIVLALIVHTRTENANDANANKSRAPMWAFAAAALGAGLLFVPWAAVLWQGREHGVVSWAANSSSPLYVAKTWVLVWSSLFFDPNQTQRWSNNSSAEKFLIPTARMLRVLVFGGVLWALVFVWRRAPRRAAIVICAIALVPFVLLAVPDLLSGGYRSTISRYMIVAYVGMLLAVTYWLAIQLFAVQTRCRGAIIFGFLLASGIGSCMLSSQSSLWWNKAASYDVPAVARILNTYSRPLLVTKFGYNILAINRLLKPQSRFYFIGNESEKNFDPSKIKDFQADAVFLYTPSKTLRAELQKRGAILEKENDAPTLWRLRPPR